MVSLNHSYDKVYISQKFDVSYKLDAIIKGFYLFREMRKHDQDCDCF